MIEYSNYTDNDDNIDYNRKAEILKVIAHPMRLRILQKLYCDSCNVKTMWECLNLPQDVVSQHLAVLRKKKILQSKREGTSVFYSIVENINIKQLISFLLD